MNRKTTNESIVVYFIKMFIIFLLVDVFIMVISNVIASSSLLNKYGNEVIIEVFYALCVLVVMLLFDNSYVFSEKKENFWTSICFAMPMLLISFWNFGYSLLTV